VVVKTLVKEATRDFLSMFLKLTAAAGGFLIWGGLSQWSKEAPFTDWFPLIFIGGILLAVGLWYHRDAWFFKPPMKSEDMKITVGNNEDEKEV